MDIIIQIMTATCAEKNVKRMATVELVSGNSTWMELCTTRLVMKASARMSI